VKHQERTPKLDPVSIVQGMEISDGCSVDSCGTLSGQAVQDITVWSRLDLGVPACDCGVAEDADLGSFVEAEAAFRMG
jgi:hypothetical protein